MDTQVKFNDSETREFHCLFGMISNISKLLKKFLGEAVSRSELTILKCSLVKLQEDAARCEAIIDSGQVFLEKLDG